MPIVRCGPREAGRTGHRDHVRQWMQRLGGVWPFGGRAHLSEVRFSDGGTVPQARALRRRGRGENEMATMMTNETSMMTNRPSMAAGRTAASAHGPRHLRDAGLPPSPRAVELLGRADSLLAEAVCAGDGDYAERFRLAYIAALRGAASALAALPAARPRRGASRSAWAQLSAAAPDFADWAGYFADHSATRAAVEAGVTSRVDAAAADALQSGARRFLDVVEGLVYGRTGAGQRADSRVGDPLSRAS